MTNRDRRFCRKQKYCEYGESITLLHNLYPLCNIVSIIAASILFLGRIVDRNGRLPRLRGSSTQLTESLATENREVPQVEYGITAVDCEVGLILMKHCPVRCEIS